MFRPHIFVLLLFFLFTVGEAAGQKLDEVNSLNKAFKRAVKENKKVFVFLNVGLSTQSSLKKRAPTMKFEFNNPSTVLLINKHFITYAPPEGDLRRDAFSKKYAVNKFPSFLFLDGNGKEFHRELGFPILMDTLNNTMFHKAIELIKD